MDLNENENSLQHLELLLSECNDSRITNERRKEIEKKLEVFSNQPDAWNLCLKYFPETKNKYAVMFCLLVVETHIKKRWSNLLASDKEMIRETLCDYLVQNHKNVQSCVQNKLGKLVVDIGRHEWPHSFPDFFDRIYQFVQGVETVHLGLMLISTVFEELSSPKEDQHASRKEEFERLVLDQVPTVLALLCGYLEKMLMENSSQGTTTPPPSPTHSINNASSNVFGTSLNTSVAFQMLEEGQHIKLPQLDVESYNLCCHLLKCLAEIFSWIPLSSFVTSKLISYLFRYVNFACAAKSESNSGQLTDVQSTSVSYTKLGVQAMTCINEIMSRNCLPDALEKYLLQILRSSSNLLQHLTNKNGNGTSSFPSNNLADVHESFLVKFSEFLQLFFNMHFKRLDQELRFPLLDFLSLLFKYTFQQATHNGFTMCLKIWSIIVDFLHSEINRRSGNRVNEMLERYKSALLALIDGIFQKLQFRFNQPNLEELDNEFLDDDEETDWQKFLQQCLDIISNVCDLMPDKVFQFVYSMFEENMKVYLELGRFVETGEDSDVSRLTVTGENDCRRLHCSLRDLSTALQAIGCLMEHLSGEHYTERKRIGECIIQKLCCATEFSNNMRFYELQTNAPLVLETDFTDVHAQLLGTLRTFCPWLVQYKRDALTSAETESRCRVECSITDLIVPNLKRKVPLKVIRNALYLFKSFTSIVRPQYLFQLPSIERLFEAVCDHQLSFMAKEDQLLIYRSMTNILLLPWLNGSEPEHAWKSRSFKHQVLMSNICRPLVEACANDAIFQDIALQSDAKVPLLLVLNILVDAISSIFDAPNSTKDAFYLSIQNVVPMVSRLFPVYYLYSDMAEEIFNFFIFLFTSLKSQAGTDVIQKTVDDFFSAINQIPLTTFFITGSQVGIHILEKFLILLQRVVSNPGASNATYLEGVINFCLEQIHPFISQFHLYATDMCLHFFSLFYDILLNNWQFFIRSTVTTQELLPLEVYEESPHLSLFCAVLETFLKTLDQPEITLFRQNLLALQNLNTRCRLFERRCFREGMVMHFLHILFMNLVHKNHDLLKEDIISVIYSMATVDFGYFFVTFIPQFIESFGFFDDGQKTSLLSSFGQETDLPTFAQNIQRFVREIRYFCSY